MDETIKRLCAAGLVLLINISSLSESEHEQAVVQDHTHQDSYDYVHANPTASFALSATMAVNDVYGELEKRVAEEAESKSMYLKILEEE